MHRYNSLASGFLSSLALWFAGCGADGADRPHEHVSGAHELLSEHADDQAICAQRGTSNIIVGTPGNDVLRGTSGPDCIIGLGGDDLLYGAGGSDVLVGGPGNDELYGEGGQDFGEGGAGNDILYGGPDGDQLLGGPGADVIHGEGGSDHLLGGEGDDLMHGGSEGDALDGADGDDRMLGGDGSDQVYGAAGADFIDGEGGQDHLIGGDCHDVVIPRPADNDAADGGAGYDGCGGSSCETTAPPSACRSDADCATASRCIQTNGLCVPSSEVVCESIAAPEPDPDAGIDGGVDAGLDGGDSTPPGTACDDDADCKAGDVCGEDADGLRVCWPATCENNVQDPTESGVDCGGECEECDEACAPRCVEEIAVLPFSAGAFRRDTAATYQVSSGKLETAGPHVLRYEDRGDGYGRMALFEGVRTNYIFTSEEVGPPEWSEWDALPAPHGSLLEDASRAPTGELAAEHVAIEASGTFPFALSLATDCTEEAGTLSAWLRGESSVSAARLLVVPLELDRVLSETAVWPLREYEWLRYSKAVSAAAELVLAHRDGWPVPSADLPLLPKSEFSVWGIQYEVAAFPSSYMPTHGAPTTREADRLTFAAEQIPAWLRNGAFQFDAAPLFGSSDLKSGEEYVLLGWQGGGVSLGRDDAGTHLRVVAGANHHNHALAWTRNAKLTITMNLPGGATAVRGATSGDGTVTSQPMSLPPGALAIGSTLAGSDSAFSRLSELRTAVDPGACTAPPGCAVCGDGVVTEPEECEPTLDAHCGVECAPTTWVDTCPNCREGQRCPDEPNGAAFDLHPSVFVCVPIGVDCSDACGESYDAPCGKCIEEPDCSQASCGAFTHDGTGGVCTGVCDPGEPGCLLDSDCTEGSCVPTPDGSSACAGPIPTGGVVDIYFDPWSPDGEACYLGPLCEPCDSACGGLCNLIGECLPPEPACPEDCELGCDNQGKCLVEAVPEWPAGEPVLPSDAVPPPLGALTVSDSGIASYTVPLAIPDGVSGHQPELSFVYSSAAGDGVLGRGWGLGGMSAISVCEPDARIASIYRGGPSLCLDGEPLLAKNLVRGRGMATHFTGLYESGYVVTGELSTVETDNPFPSQGDDMNAHAWVPGREFKVRHEDGRTFFYGHASDDAFLLLGGADPAMGPSSIRQWLLRQVTDRFGNTIEYRYQKGRVTVRGPELYSPANGDYVRSDDGAPVEERADAEAILRWIGYNGGSAEISFHYVGDDKREECTDPLDPYCELATDLQLGRWHGGPLGRLMVLSRVDVRVSARAVRSYGMGYAVTKSGGTRLLKTLQECGFAQGKRSCAPPLTFDYGDRDADDEGEMGERLLAAGRSDSYVSDEYPFRHYAQLHPVVFDADGDGRDDFASFDTDGSLYLSTADREQSFQQVSDGSEFPVFFYYRAKEQGEPWYARLGRTLLGGPTLGYTHALRWGEGSHDSTPITSGVVPTDINHDGLTDLVVWGADRTQHVNHEEGDRDDCGAMVLCGTRKRKKHYIATYPLGIWVYEASMQDGELSYSPRRILHEGFVGDEPGFAAMLPDIEGKGYYGIRVNNKGPGWAPKASIVTFDHNDDGQLDFLYCNEGLNGLLIESDAGLVHPGVADILGSVVPPNVPDYKFTPIAGLPLEFCLDAQTLQTRQGRTELWSPTTRLVLSSTPAGPALFRETTFGELDFSTINVRQVERNGDGLPDLAFNRVDTDELEFWLNAGTGFVEGHAIGFQPAGVIKNCDFKYLGEASIADVDGNGLDDLVIPGCEGGTNGAPGTLKVHYMHPGGKRVQATLDTLGEHGKASADSTPYGAWPGDFDGDGDTDFRYVSARWTDPWRYRVGQLENTSFSSGSSWKLLTRVHSTPVAGQPGTELLVSYAAGNGSRIEGGSESDDGAPAHRGELQASCEPRQSLVETAPPIAGSVTPDTGRGGERASIYSRTAARGGCPLGELLACAAQLPHPVVASYVMRTADLARTSGTEAVWADCSKTQMFYENGKKDTYQGFVGFERVTRRILVPEARRSVEVAEFDLGATPLAPQHIVRTGETVDGGDASATFSILPRLYVRPFAGLARTRWVDEPMPSGVMRTTETDYSRALLGNGGVERRFAVTYAESRLPLLRVFSDRGSAFWSAGTRGPTPPLMVVPVLRQDRAIEGSQTLSTTATYWLRNADGFVDTELSFGARESDVEDLRSAIFLFAAYSSQNATGRLDPEAIAGWFNAEHDASAISARHWRQVTPDDAPATWEGRIGLFALPSTETATAWARPLGDGRQDVRRVSQSFDYFANGSLERVTEAFPDGSSHTYAITERASTGAIKGVAEWAADEWNSPANGRGWSFAPDEYGLYTVEATNTYGHVSKTRFDYASGQPVRTEDADGVVTHATYDAFGRLASETVENAETTISYLWESASPVTVTLPGNPTGVTEVRVNASYRVVETMTSPSLTEVSGETWFDAAGRVVRSGQRGPLGDMVWTERAYDSRGRLTIETRPHTGDTRSSQGAVAFSYDGLDRPTRVTRPNDGLDGTRWTEAQYGSIGDPGAVAAWLGSGGRVRAVRQHTSDSERAALVRTFDAAGRLRSSLEQHAHAPSTPTTTYAFGLSGPMAITGPDGATLRTDFDTLGRPAKTVDPSAGTYSWRYDALGRLREERDNSTLHTLAYDLLDRPVTHTRHYEGTDAAFGADKTTTWEWDALAGEVPEARNAGKLLRVSDDAGFAESYTYGGRFALRDSVTRVVPRPSSSPLSLETRYEYDGDGRLHVLRHPGGERAQTYRYNERGALTSVDATINGATSTIWELEKVYEGRLPHEVRLLQGKLTQTYYAGTAALKRLTMKVGETDLVDETLRYNESGLLEEHADLANAKTESFFYDRFRRLHERRSGSGRAGPVLESFAFSSGGRVEHKSGATLSYAVPGQPARWPDAVKRLERGTDALSYGYHASYGLMTSIQGRWEGSEVGLGIEYDLNRQVRLARWDSGVTRTLGYAPTGDRASMHETGGDVESFVAYAGSHYERAESGSNVVHLFRFTDGEGSVLVEERVEEQMLEDGSTLEVSVGSQHLARDYRGSVTAILPDGGEVARRSYEAYGGPVVAGGTDLGYTGHRQLQIDDSPLGLIDMGGRMFDPLSAQFTRADPFMPGADTPKGFNRLAYVEGDPINFIDPTGFKPDCNPKTGACEEPPPLEPPPSGSSTTGPICNHWCQNAKKDIKEFFKEDVKNFFRAISGTNRVQDNRARERRERRYKSGLFHPQGGGSAPNTSSGTLGKIISAIDQIGQGLEQEVERMMPALERLALYAKAFGGAGVDAGVAMAVPSEGDAVLMTSGVGAALADGLLPIGETYLAGTTTYVGARRLARGVGALGKGLSKVASKTSAALRARADALRDLRKAFPEDFPRFHGNSLEASGPHRVYAVLDRATGNVLRFGETGDLAARHGAHERYFRSLGYRIDIQVLRVVEGKAAARALETRYIRAYRFAFGRRPRFNLSDH